MTDFGDWILRKWYPGCHTSGSVEALANLAVLLEEELKATDAECWCAPEDDCPRHRAYAAVAEFMEKYSDG